MINFILLVSERTITLHPCLSADMGIENEYFPVLSINSSAGRLSGQVWLAWSSPTLLRIAVTGLSYYSKDTSI